MQKSCDFLLETCIAFIVCDKFGQSIKIGLNDLSISLKKIVWIVSQLLGQEDHKLLEVELYNNDIRLLLILSQQIHVQIQTFLDCSWVTHIPLDNQMLPRKVMVDNTSSHIQYLLGNLFHHVMLSNFFLEVVQQMMDQLQQTFTHYCRLLPTNQPAQIFYSSNYSVNGLLCELGLVFFSLLDFI